ncbi:MAG: hypothetical protein Q9227_008674 [Pyrenula ochraceoflavens]
MPPLIRRQTRLQKIKAFFNPHDFWLWLSEEIETSGWDQVEKEWAIPIGIALNVLFVLCRSNAGYTSTSGDGVFEDDVSESGGFSYLCWFGVNLLALLSLANTAITFFRKRRYRLFEARVDIVPSTPSARRVKVDADNVSSSPLRFLSTILGAETAESRAHPDQTQDVWEVAVWDPLPICLRLFCYFSPGHVMIYWLSLPTSPNDPRPSTTIATAVVAGILLSVQLSALHVHFSQQSKDTALIHKEVMNEYDTKYVHPRTQHLYRDVGTQFSTEAQHSVTRDEKYNKVDTFSPMFIINRGFQANPNPAYTKHTTRDPQAQQQALSRRLSATPNLQPSAQDQSFQTPQHLRDFSSPMRPNTAIRQPQFRSSVGPGAGDGGSLGVYTHAQSPLRKTQSTNFEPRSSGYTNESVAARERASMSPDKRLPRSSLPGGLSNIDAARRRGLMGIERRESGRF